MRKKNRIENKNEWMNEKKLDHTQTHRRRRVKWIEDS